MIKKRSTALKSIVLAGLIAGLLDAAAAMINYMINVPGGNPLKVWRFVSSGVLGPAALSKSLVPMALAGLFFHFIIAFLFAMIFRLVLPGAKWMQKNLLITGLLYGLIIWIIMNLIVLPLSNIPERAKLWKLSNGDLNFQLPADRMQLIIGILILMFCVGLPISLIIGKKYKIAKL